MFNKQYVFSAFLCISLSIHTVVGASSPQGAPATLAQLTATITRQNETIAAQGRAISELSKTVALLGSNAQHNIALPFYKIRSLSDAYGWTWNHKKSILLTGTAMTLVYIVYNACNEGTKTRQLIMRLFDILNRQHTEGCTQRAILLDGVNDLRTREGLPELSFEEREEHELHNPDNDWTAKAWNGICSAGRFALNGISYFWK